MIRIYEIEMKDLQKVKNILETPDVATGELDVELEKEAGKKGSSVEKAKTWKINEFKRNGYILREARALDIDKKSSYLYINAPDDFFERNEKILLGAGAKLLEGKEYENVKAKIEESEAGAAEGLGLIFGG